MTDDQIKEALKMMPYGFYSVTSRHGDDVNAMVANWIAQVSFEPRLLAAAIQKSCYTHGLIEKGRVFAINIFRQEDQELIMPFTKGRAKDPDKMKDAEYDSSPVIEVPILKGAAAYIEFEVVQIIDIGGDHDIVVGRPVGAGIMKPGDAAESLTLPKIGWSYAG